MCVSLQMIREYYSTAMNNELVFSLSFVVLQPEEPVIAHASAWTHGALNPETTIQSTATEQERSSPPVQSQEQERERPSESAMSLEGESTQTSERPEDERERTQQTHKKNQKKKDCQIM